ncbi:class I SAM-dependent methyltransferase [Blautia sp. MSJ-19]|uniref:class I SAM-dependent methyltransferase n=1 Tax=Blautia sp. MSJ-19 TaxID=2841517 RepID=UPI001C0F034A|nr:SAM-dependent methyltransferase [Blautia sp. MSJ-19]MBU5482461.1 SAM-dependent methyltransferase [Blautia sp. MSJ-19]
MMTLQEFLEKQFDGELMLAVLSGQRSKEKDAPVKVRIRQVELKGTVCYQASSTVGTKVLHSNYTREEVQAFVKQSLETGGFSQLQVQGRCKDGTVLISKKGKATIKVKQHQALEPVQILAHNRVKQYILREGIPVPFLIDLGVMNKEGRIHRPSYDKFRQINRFLEFIEDILPALSREREVTILDFGCGKSYLTFAMYYYLKELKGYDVHIIGLDLKEDVIRKCNGLAEKYGYDKLHFLHGDIADYEGVEKVDMVVTLHACDKATDYALAKAVEWDAQVILSVPCCQHELNDQIQNEMLAPVLQYGILKERMSALLTDGIRAELLESKGYSTQILEFIDMEHTPKNLLIRAVKTGKCRPVQELAQLTDAVHGHLTLEKLLYPEGICTQKGV